MKDTLNKYKQSKGSKISKILQFLLIMVGCITYVLILLIWTPETYVSILGTSNVVKYLKIGISIVLAIYIAIQIDVNFLRAPKYGHKQIEEYELWNKFFLHFAFMKTGSSNEKSQVLEVLRYLEDSELKQTLTDVYEQNTSLKDAHNAIVQKYPYPQVKTFFSESEDALVRGADGNRLMQKTALNIDKYINDISSYNQSKLNSYKTSLILLITVVILTLVAKVGFNVAFIEFSESNTGFIILGLYLILITKLLVKIKRNANRPLIDFGGDDHE